MSDVPAGIETVMKKRDLPYSNAYAIDAPVRISGSYARLQTPFTDATQSRFISLASDRFSEDKAVQAARTEVKAQAADQTCRVQTAITLQAGEENARSFFDANRRRRLSQQLAPSYAVQETTDEETGVPIHNLMVTDTKGYSHKIRLGVENADDYERWRENRKAGLNKPEDDPEMPSRAVPHEVPDSAEAVVGVFSSSQPLTMQEQAYGDYIKSHAAVLKDVFRALE